MVHLDLRSVLLLVGVMSALIGVVLLFMRRSYPSSIRGIGEWAIALLILFSSTFLFGARGAISDLWTVVVANLLVVAGYALFYIGTQRFLGLQARPRFWGVVTVVVVAGLAWYTLGEPHYGRRVLLITPVMASLSFCHGWAILKLGPRTFPTFFAGGALVAQGAIQVGRFLFALEAPAADALFESSLHQTLFITAYAFVLLLSGLGVVLLATEQLLNQFSRLAESEKRRLEELGAMKDQFFTDLAHELRTPLTLVLGPLDDLSAHMVHCGDEPNLALERVRRNALRLQDLVEQLLDAARLDSGGLRLRTRRADLAAFLRRVGERFQAEAARRHLILEVDTDAVEAWLYFDTDLLDKVLTNLLGNALKFTPEGGRIRLELTPPPTLGGDDAPLEAFARVCVVDNGIGMSEAEAARLFERFYQADGAGERRREGSGIGLSLARGLVELHGGQMGVTSRFGEGTTFWFTLPAGVAHLSPDEIDLDARADGPPQAPKESQGSGPAPDDDTLPVLLVVEDNPDMRAYLVEHLAALGRVVEAADGMSALAIALRVRPRLIVSDVMMPEMDGIALGRALRSDPTLQETPLLLVTAKASPDDLLEALSVADDHLTKPFRMQELLARVRNLLARIVPQAATTQDAAPAPTSMASAEPAASPNPECDRAFAEQMRAAVIANLRDSACGVPCLARAVGLSPRQLQRRCREVSGQGPLEFIRGVRMEEARGLVQRGAFKTVAEVAAAVGLSPSYFARLYIAWHGRPPSGDLRS